MKKPGEIQNNENEYGTNGVKPRKIESERERARKNGTTKRQ